MGPYLLLDLPELYMTNQDHEGPIGTILKEKDAKQTDEDHTSLARPIGTIKNQSGPGVYQPILRREEWDVEIRLLGTEQCSDQIANAWLTTISAVTVTFRN